MTGYDIREVLPEVFRTFLEEVGEKKEEQPEKAKNMSESEKEGYNEEFNKAIERPIPKYVIPPLDLLSKPKATSGDKREEMRRTAEKLISVLDNFGVKANCCK